VMEGEGRVGDYVGGYSDWQRLRPEPVDGGKASKSVPQASADPKAAAKRRLSYKESRELEQLPARIESLESELSRLGAAMQQPDFFRQSPDAIADANRRTAETQASLDAAYQRWQELEAG